MTVLEGDSVTHKLTTIIRNNTHIGQSAGVRTLGRPLAIQRNIQNMAEIITASGRNLIEVKLIATQRATINNSIEVIQTANFFTFAMRLS